jgi:hypothetical protein
MTGATPAAFNGAGRLRQALLESRIGSRSQVEDAIAIPIGTGKTEISARSGIEDEGLVSVRRCFIGLELQMHGNPRHSRENLAKRPSRGAPAAQAFRAILKRRRASRRTDTRVN